MIDWVLFGALAGTALGAAGMVVRTDDLVHAVLWLAVALLATAGLYATLDAGFLAAIQVLLYTGGVITLMLFAVLLSRHGSQGVPAGPRSGGLRAGLAAGGVLVLVLAAITRDAGAAGGPPVGLDPQALGAVLLGAHLLPFEVLSVLLLAAMIGAIVLARRKEG